MDQVNIEATRKMLGKLRALTGIPTIYRFIPRFRFARWGETDVRYLYAVQPVARDYRGQDMVLEQWELWEIWDHVPDWVWEALDEAVARGEALRTGTL